MSNVLTAQYVLPQPAVLSVTKNATTSYFVTTTKNQTAPASTMTVCNPTTLSHAAVTAVSGTFFPPELKVPGDGFGKYRVQDGNPCVIELPDGTVVDVKADGSHEVLDSDAKVIYRANRMRDFNSYMNASDKLEDFIKFCGRHGIRKREMLDLPINLFIGWLIVEAARADNEPPPPVRLVEDLRKRKSPRCVFCGRFIRVGMAARQIHFCGSSCFDGHLKAARPYNLKKHGCIQGSADSV